MYRGIIYGIAVLALIVNALTPKTISPDTHPSGKVLAACHIVHSGRVEYPQSQQQLRVSSRAFSCPLPMGGDSEYVLPEVPSLNVEPLAVSHEFVYNSMLPDSSCLLNFQCRLNI